MMQTPTQYLLLIGLIAGSIPGFAQAEPLDCLIQPHQIVQVGSAVPGLIESIAVERGDVVEKGEPLARLQASVERAALSLARARAEVQAEVDAAGQSTEFAQRELARANELASRNFVSRNYIDKASTEASLAHSKLRQVQEKRKMALRELEVAQAQLDMRTIRSPLSGVVVDRFLSAGEYIDEKPMLKIAKIDPLRVEVVVPASAYGRIRQGMTAAVVPTFAGATAHEATVTVVDGVIDPASSTFRVRLSLPNPNREIPAGLRCKVDLGLSFAAAPSRPVAAAGSAR